MKARITTPGLRDFPQCTRVLDMNDLRDIAFLIPLLQDKRIYSQELHDGGEHGQFDIQFEGGMFLWFSND